MPVAGAGGAAPCLFPTRERADAEDGQAPSGTGDSRGAGRRAQPGWHRGARAPALRETQPVRAVSHSDAALGAGAYDAYGRAARVKRMSGGGTAPLPGLAGRLCFAWGLSQEEGLPPRGARGSAGAGQAEGAAGREPAPPQFPGRRPAGLQATPEWPALWPTDTHTVCATTHGK